MRILIAGGLGFVGGRLAQCLSAAGHRVVIGTRRRDAASPGLADVEVVHLDWASDRSLAAACDGADGVINAAGMSAVDCAAAPAQALAFNGVATARLAGAAADAGVGSFIYLSSAHVYASPLTGSFDEESCPKNLHPYATSHLAGELAVRHAALAGSMAGLVLRLSNAFGPPAHPAVDCWGLLVNDLCRQAVETGKLVLRSSGDQYRDFVPLGDVCGIVREMIEGKTSGNRDGIFNVGAGKAMTVLAMAERIRGRCREVLGWLPDIERPTAKTGAAAELHYRSLILPGLGSRFEAAVDAEIDGLLRFCGANFRRIPLP